MTDPVEAPPGRLREFLRAEAAGGAALVVAAVIALIWANSPWQHGYEGFWGTELGGDLGPLSLSEDLRHWVNDALMALFFFVVGLEIKRELVKGDLRDRRTAALPVVAALGGMVVPALIYTALNAGNPGGPGWGIPMATDIAFAVGVLSLLGSRVPSALKLFLLTLAIVDDIGAIVVIAVFYAGDLDLLALAAAVGLVLVMVAIRRAGVSWLPVFVALGAAVWLATYLSGVHATIAGVVLGLLAPVGRDRDSVSVGERLEHRLHPFTSFFVVPVFALANAGVTLRADAFDGPGAGRIIIGVVLGLVLGKTAGIAAATGLAVRSGIARLPEGATWGHVVGVSAVAGIGFTVSLFIAGLAFDPGSTTEDAAKIGILIGSTGAALLGTLLLSRRRVSR